jgi:hypothetical protein
LYAFIISPKRATCPVHFILLYTITLIRFGEAYKLWSSSLCNLPQPPATSSLFSETIYVLPLVWETKFNTSTKQQVKLQLFNTFRFSSGEGKTKNSELNDSLEWS